VSKPTILAGVVTPVEIKSLKPDPGQPRKAFDEASLLALADNIRERGVQQPLLVRSLGAGGLQIVDGERRWRAAKLAKIKSVPVLLVDVGELDQLRLDQVSVNQLREQLKPMELARVLRGLRDAGKTTNDIAATLAKQGLPAMKPAAINELAELTALPDWAQAMVNAEQLETAHAAMLLPILNRKGVEKPLQKALADQIGYSGKLERWDVGSCITTALAKAGGVSLTSTESYSPKPIVHFAFKTRCKGCEHLQRFGDSAFCMSRKTFEEHNQEAKDAGLLPGGRRPQKKVATTADSEEAQEAAAEKAEQRERSLTEKARDYLHRRLCVALIEELPKRPPLQLVLAVWRALKNPGSRGTRGAHPIDAPIPAHYASLEQLAGEKSPWQIETATLDAALNIVNELPWRETHALARLLWGDDLFAVWTIDREFLDLFRKAELVHLAGVHGCALPEGRRSWDAMKGDEIKDALLTQHEKLLRPAILADLYQGEIEEPFRPWRPGDEDDDDLPDFGLDDDDEMEDAA
jgi:ParB family chromosome partitioning protein